MKKGELHDILYRLTISMSDKNKLYNFFKQFIDLFKGDKIDEKYLPQSDIKLKTINGKDIKGEGNIIVNEGIPTIKAGTGNYSEIFNYNDNTEYISKANGDYSHAEGFNTKATKQSCHAEGHETYASGKYNHSEGYNTGANREASHSEGYNTYATGSNTHSEGYNTKATASYSHAEGNGSNAIGEVSHAEGAETKANKYASHSEGWNTIANGDCCHVEGLFNTGQEDSIHEVGIGTGNDTRKDANRITTDGRHYILNIGGFDGSKATADFTTEKDLATVISDFETRIAALEAKQTT